MVIDVDSAVDLFKALSNRLRLEIVLQLRHQEHCVHELVEATGATQALVSQHLRVLRSAKAVSAERRGKEVFYSLTDHHITHIVLDAIEHTTEGTNHDS